MPNKLLFLLRVPSRKCPFHALGPGPSKFPTFRVSTLKALLILAQDFVQTLYIQFGKLDEAVYIYTYTTRK